MSVPEPFATWFADQGWDLHPHQTDLIACATDPATLLIAPTGGGKTLAGFLPSLIELGATPPAGLHTLYVSPLKALASDIRRNLSRPVSEMGLAIRIEDRTGDTKPTQRKRQRVDPPHILLTTPESLALLLSYEDAERIFSGLQRVIVDEIHALAESKRGDQLMLGLARLQRLAPGLRRVGLSATVENPANLARFLGNEAQVMKADPGPDPDISILQTRTPPPWSGMGGRYAACEVMDLVEQARTTLIFINTRAQAELFFQALWAANESDLPIGLHHGSLSREARHNIEAAMVAGALRAIVCTGSLDLGIDWGDVDLVIQIGAPKNVKRLVQRIGRANHRYNAPSRAILVPSNRFELLECHAALAAVYARDLDGDPRDAGGLDVLCQHILLCACSAPFASDMLYDEVCTAGPYADLAREDFDACLEFCATGGYALAAYDRWRRLIERDGFWQLRDPRRARDLRMNIGTIVDTETLKVRMKNRRGGTPLGEVEEAFAASLTPGDTFLIGGQTVRYEGLREMVVEVTKTPSAKPKIAVFMGTKLATSTVLSRRVLENLHDPSAIARLPQYAQDWITTQADLSRLPQPDRLLVETFPRGDQHFLCVYGFAGTNALRTLGLLLTRRMEISGLAPLGFVANDYALLIWGLEPVQDAARFFDETDFLDGLDDWLKSNAVMKRTFRNAATIAGLIERNLPSQRKSGRQATFSSDILYDTLIKYDPDHLMLRITRQEARRGLVDFGRIEHMIARIQGKIDHIKAPHVTPFAAPLLLEVGRVPIHGEGRDRLAEAQIVEILTEAGIAEQQTDAE